MYSIGEFSTITKITAKALRHYHEIRLLIPIKIDQINNYRFYSAEQIEVAMIITDLKEFGFSLEEIKEIITKLPQRKDLVKFLEAQKEKIIGEIENYSAKVKKLEGIIKEKEKTVMNNIDLGIQEKDLPDMLIASIKHQGHYKEVGPLFRKLGMACGPKICGPALTMHYDNEYKEGDASYEAAMPIKGKIDKKGINVRTLKGGHAITIVHKGPYEAIGGTYRKIIDYMNKKQMKSKVPSREIYLKGPGLFRNPKKYITEIQFMI